MAEGSASEVLDVNFEVGIILPRGTPARSGVMHSMSSIPRARSHCAASFQLLTPRAERRLGGTVATFETCLEALSGVFLAGIKHRHRVDRNCYHSRSLAIGEGGGVDFRLLMEK